MKKKNLKLYKEKDEVNYQRSPGIDLIIALLFLIIIIMIFSLFYVPASRNGEASRKLDPRIKEEIVSTTKPVTIEELDSKFNDKNNASTVEFLPKKAEADSKKGE